MLHFCRRIGVRPLMRLCSIPMRRSGRLTLALIVATALSGCGEGNVRPTTSPRPIASFCDLLVTPGQFGAVVSFQAIASTDFHHGITLRDPACPDTGIRVGHPAEGADQSVERFFNQLRLLAPHMTWRSARGSFTGRITLNASGKRRVALLAADDFLEVAHEP